MLRNTTSTIYRSLQTTTDQSPSTVHSNNSTSNTNLDLSNSLKLLLFLASVNIADAQCDAACFFSSPSMIIPTAAIFTAFVCFCVCLCYYGENGLCNVNHRFYGSGNSESSQSETVSQPEQISKPNNQEPPSEVVIEQTENNRPKLG